MFLEVWNSKMRLGACIFMIVKDLMEDAQLNFDQPLLSVRRGPSTPTLANQKESTYSASHLPYYKSELKSGSVRNPGSVPFQWERMPGRPKDETTPQPKSVEQPPLAPKLPPGRIINHIPKHSRKSSTDSAVIMAAVDNAGPPSHCSSEVENVAELEVSTKQMDQENMSTAEDDDSNYVDALDTLSRTESAFLNSTVSGASGADGFYIKPSGSFTDPHARDFMMGRFLPAAQAVALEVPQFCSRKQHVVKEEPELPKKAIRWDWQSTVYIPCTPDKMEEEDGVSDDSEEDERTGTKNWSGKGCGLLPRFCLLNPVPGIREVTPISIPLVRKAYRKTVSATSNTRHEISPRNAYQVKKTAISARKPVVGRLEIGVVAENRNLRLNKTSNATAYRKLDESLKNLPNAAAPYLNALPHSFSHEGKRSQGIPEEAKGSQIYKNHSHGKDYKNTRNLLADQTAAGESGGSDPAIEKTLYIDSLQVIESQSLCSSSSERWATDSKRHSPSVDYITGVDKHIRSADGKETPTSRNMDMDSVAQTSMKRTVRDVHNVMKEAKQDQYPKLEPHDMAPLKLDDGCRPDLIVQQLGKDDVKTMHNHSKQSLLTLPLPKSPSESWLSRTLPAMHARTPYSKLHPGFQWQQEKHANSQSPIGSKWETMVKDSNTGQTNTYLTKR
ncbi:hypothetical protein AKJ16_DCAP22153 [Drosera capensis]